MNRNPYGSCSQVRRNAGLAKSKVVHPTQAGHARTKETNSRASVHSPFPPECMAPASASCQEQHHSLIQRTICIPMNGRLPLPSDLSSWRGLLRAATAGRRQAAHSFRRRRGGRLCRPATGKAPHLLRQDQGAREDWSAAAYG